jgi:hypothetical protein
MHRWTIAVVVYGLAMSAPATGQTAIFPVENGRALAGIQAFDARVSILTWLEVRDDRDRLRNNMQAAFELALRRDGVVVDRGAPNYLICELWMAESSGLLSYVWIVNYYDFEPQGVHRLLWRSGGIVTVGRTNFSAESAAKSCADGFAIEWLKWNPRR